MKSSNSIEIKGKLVSVKTENDIDLAGFLSQSSKKTEKLLIMSHGRGGTFYSGYSSFLPYLVDAAFDSGYDFLGVSDRGSGFFRLYDIFEDCVADYNSWIKFAEDLGYKEIVLGAHSYGPIKISYYYDQLKPDSVKGLFFLDPTDTFGIWKNYIQINDEKYLNLAEKLVSESRGKDLMPNEAYYNPISAQSYLSLYGKGSKIHIFDFQNQNFDFNILKSISIPVFTVLAGTDKNSRDAKAKDKQRILESVLQKPTIKIIKGTDHVFAGKGEDLQEHLASWLKEI